MEGMVMRFITVSGIAAVIAIICFSPINASAAQYVQITEPFVNVYERLDPKSNVVKTAAKGERFELIFAGDKWYNVKVKSQMGWVERKAGRIIEGRSVVPMLLTIALIVALVGGTLYVVITYINKQKSA
jgi:hypothetical protein